MATDVQCDVLTKEEEYKLAIKAKAGDEDARNRIIMGMYKLIVREAGRLARKYGKETDDLIGVGVLRIVENFDGFDPSRGMRASSYFILAAKRAMWAHINRHDRLIELPEIDKNTPDHLKEQANKVAHVGSLNFIASSREGSAEIGSLVEDASAVMPEDEVARREEKECDQDQYNGLLRFLPERLRIIVRLRSEDKTLAEIGEVLGITRERVRQLEVKAMAKLRAVADKPQVVVSRERPMPEQPLARVETVVVKQQQKQKPRGECQHCHQEMSLAARGICMTCYRLPEVRNLYSPAKRGPAPASSTIPMVRAVCAFCQKEFPVRWNKQKCCSRKCAARKIGVEKNPNSIFAAGFNERQMARQSGETEFEISEVPIPEMRNEFDDIWNSLLAAWKKGVAIKVKTGTHQSSIRQALKRRLKDHPEMNNYSIAMLVGDDGYTIYLEATNDAIPISDVEAETA